MGIGFPSQAIATDNVRPTLGRSKTTHPIDLISMPFKERLEPLEPPVAGIDKIRHLPRMQVEIEGHAIREATLPMAQAHEVLAKPFIHRRTGGLIINRLFDESIHDAFL